MEAIFDLLIRRMALNELKWLVYKDNTTAT